MDNTFDFQNMVTSKITAALYWIGVTWLSTIFLPIAPVLIVMAVLVLADFVLGRKAALVRAEDITSKKYRRTVWKFGGYFLTILSARLLEWGFDLPDWAVIAKITAGLICLTEFKSIVENISTITGNDFWAVLVNKLPNVKDWVAPQKKDKQD